MRSAEEKRMALDAIVNHIIPGRADDLAVSLSVIQAGRLAFELQAACNH